MWMKAILVTPFEHPLRGNQEMGVQEIVGKGSRRLVQRQLFAVGLGERRCLPTHKGRQQIIALEGTVDVNLVAVDVAFALLGVPSNELLSDRVGHLPEITVLQIEEALAPAGLAGSLARHGQDGSTLRYQHGSSSCECEGTDTCASYSQVASSRNRRRHNATWVAERLRVRQASVRAPAEVPAPALAPLAVSYGRCDASRSPGPTRVRGRSGRA